VLLIDTDSKLKTANKDVIKLKSKLQNVTKRTDKAKSQRGSKSEVKSTKTESFNVDDQAQHIEVGI